MGDGGGLGLGDGGGLAFGLGGGLALGDGGGLGLAPAGVGGGGGCFKSGTVGGGLLSVDGEGGGGLGLAGRASVANSAGVEAGLLVGAVLLTATTCVGGGGGACPFAEDQHGCALGELACCWSPNGGCCVPARRGSMVFQAPQVGGSKVPPTNLSWQQQAAPHGPELRMGSRPPAL